MKSNINTILPIALSVILPGLSLLVNAGINPYEKYGLIKNWLVASVILYTLWQMLWRIWYIKSKYFKWILAGVVIGLLVLVFAVNYFLVFKSVENIEWSFLGRFGLGIILILAIQYALKTQEGMSSLLLEKEQIQTENYKAQLQALRAKVDPHFLFNSLNTLRSMVRQQHDNSERFIISLSDFYRQTLKHNENTTLQLSEELGVLESYLFLMKSRNEEAMAVSMEIDESLLQFHIPTLALQVVVENCFKHNSMTSKMPLHIDIKSTDEYYIEVSNNIQPRIGEREASGYGLDLLRKRYHLMNVKDGVIVEQTGDQFKVRLKLV